MATDKQRSLEINEHLDFQRRFRVFRLAGTAALVALVLAALAGLLGGGPLSTTRASAGALQVEYDRFLHRDHPSHFRLRTTPGEDHTELVLRGGLVEAFDITHLVPQPEQAMHGDGEARYRFAEGTTTVLLEMQPLHMGPVGGRVGAGGESVELRMFVYP